MKLNLIKTFTFAAVLFSVAAHADILPMKLRPAGHQYALVEMKPGKVESDLAKGIKTLNDQEREQARLVIKGGMVYHVDGRPVSDTKEGSQLHDDRNNYVMDANGNFYLFNEFKFPKVRHSSIFGGKAVAGAGEITIKGSRITYIDADSGHYSSRKLMPQVVTELKQDGLDIGTLSKIVEENELDKSLLKDGK